MKILTLAKTFALSAAISTAPILINRSYSKNYVPQQENVDTFEHSITPKGSTDSTVLAHAPNPHIKIAGKNKIAGIVVDIDSNILYRYDKDGKALKAYLVASGKEDAPTTREVRIVSHIEKYPYNTAHKTSYRRRHPEEFGPYILCLNRLNTKTGKQSLTGQFIHGCKSYEETFQTDPERRVSHGCVRMEESAITGLALGSDSTELDKALKVKPGEIVIIK